MSTRTPVVRLYSDSEGESHFEDRWVPLESVEFAPPAPPLNVSDFEDAARVGFLSGPAGWFGDWHPAPARQYMALLSGELEVQVSDGETRRFQPGAVALLEDTTGKGHATRVTEGPFLMLVVQLGD